MKILLFLLYLSCLMLKCYGDFKSHLVVGNSAFIRPCLPEDEIPSICRNPDDLCHEKSVGELRLVKLDGVKIDYVQEVELEKGKNYTMITRAMKPVIFEIPNFLSSKECDHIIELAKASGLAQSVAGFDQNTYDGELERELNTVDDTKPALGPDDILAEKFDTWDGNEDGVVSFDEINNFVIKYDTLYLTRDDVTEMLKRLGFKGYDKGEITREEFQRLGIKKLLAYLWHLKDKHPRHRPRYSEQAWLHHNRTADPILKRLLDRVTKITKLPRKLVRGSESVQVVRYETHGHYHGHLDSSPITNREMTCCHQNVYNKPECRLCRFLTILYYLNDVEEGGETAFVVADNATYVIDKSLVNPNRPADEFNLSANCKLAKLVIPPKKGTAVMWYNHFIDEESGLLGDIDNYSFHGGCDIKKGIKWIANNWITAPTKRTAHIKSIYDVGIEDS